MVKDTEDLRWALRNGVDMVACLSSAPPRTSSWSTRSWTRKVASVDECQDEEAQAVENLNEIIDAFDAFMVARGDLGVEMPLEEVPLVQKKIVAAARRWAK